MSRIFAQSVTADLCGRLFNRLLLVLLLPFILILSVLPQPRSTSVPLAAVPVKSRTKRGSRRGRPGA